MFQTELRASPIVVESKASSTENKSSCDRIFPEPATRSGFSHQKTLRLNIPLVASREKWQYVSSSSLRFSVASKTRIAAFNKTAAVKIEEISEGLLSRSHCVLVLAMSSRNEAKRYKFKMTEGLADLECSKWDSKPRASEQMRFMLAEAIVALVVGTEEEHQKTSSTS